MIPFDPNVPEATQNSGITTEQRPSVTEEPGAETVALRRRSSLTPTILPAEALTTQQPDKPRVSTSNVFPPTSSPTAVAETGGAVLPFDPRRLHSEVESLRLEMERLRAEGLVVAAPPSYKEGDV